MILGFKDFNWHNETLVKQTMEDYVRRIEEQMLHIACPPKDFAILRQIRCLSYEEFEYLSNNSPANSVEMLDSPLCEFLGIYSTSQYNQIFRGEGTLFDKYVNMIKRLFPKIAERFEKPEPVRFDVSPSSFLHTFVAGASGSGKTYAVKTIITDLLETDYYKDCTVIAFDVQGTLVEEIGKSATYDRPLWYFNPTLDYDKKFTINPFDTVHNEVTEGQISAAFSAMLGSDEFSDAQERVLPFIISLVLRYSGNMRDIAKILSVSTPDITKMTSEQRKWVMKGRKLSNIIHRDFWELFPKNVQEQTRKASLSKVVKVLEKQSVYDMMCRESTLDTVELVNSGATCLFDMNGAIPSQCNYLSFLISSIMSTCFAGLNDRDVIMVMDEAQYYTNKPLIETAMSKSRKYGMRFMIVSQMLTEKFDSASQKEILTNCTHFVMGRGTNKEIKRLVNDEYEDELPNRTFRVKQPTGTDTITTSSKYAKDNRPFKDDFDNKHHYKEPAQDVESNIFQPKFDD